MSAADPLSPNQLRDRRHLRLLAAGYLCLGALFTSCSCFSLPSFVVFMVAVMHPHNAGSSDLLREVPLWVTGVAIAALLLLSILLARTFIFTCQSYSQRRNLRLLRFSAWLVIAAFPLGTMLGIGALLVLRRPSVLALFDVGDQPASGDGVSAPSTTAGSTSSLSPL